jgi:hypothetical protein
LKKLLARFARVSPAMIVAMIALFVALSGTAVATTSALIGSAQIRNNSITGLDVKNRSLRPIDFRGSIRGPRGLRGLTGATGATGAPGATGAKGDTGATGARGPSDGLSIRGATAIALTGVDQTLVTLNLAAGKWLLTTKVVAVNQDTVTRQHRCELRIGGTVIDRNHAGAVGVPVEADDREMFTLTNGVDVAAATTANLVCISLGYSDGFWVEPSMTAVQVATLNGA